MDLLLLLLLMMMMMLMQHPDAETFQQYLHKSRQSHQVRGDWKSLEEEKQEEEPSSRELPVASSSRPS
jgi:hypothetical protein